MQNDKTQILCVNSVTKRVQTREGLLTILDDINFNVSRGVSVAILGSSGSGKTTLLGLLAGLDLPTEGSIVFNHVDITRLDEDARAGLRAGNVGFVFQNFQLMQGLTALENVMLPLELSQHDNPSVIAQQLLARVGLEERASHYPNQLSGGEQQRCAIARAFATKPSVLFADEPTGNLDQDTGDKIINLLFELNREQGTTLLMATHDIKLAGQCDLRIRLEKGQLKTIE